jgi:hypothetical protein
MFHALKDLVGQFDCIQRSLIFISDLHPTRYAHNICA